MGRGLSDISLFVVVMAGLSACSSSASPGDAGCQAETDQKFCTRLGLNCEVFTGFDNCGTSRSVNCGTCPSTDTCDNSVCRSPSTSGTSGGGGATTGGTTGGTSSGAGGTTGGTTGSADGGCSATFCGGYPDVFSASFVLGAWNSHGDATIDSLVGEHITMIIGFNGGTPGSTGPDGYQFPNSPTEISVSGDASGLIAADMLASWQTGGTYFNEDQTARFLDFELLPPSQAGTFFSYEMHCTASGETGGAPLVSTDCSSPDVTVRYFTGGNNMVDSISSTSATASLYAADAG